MKTAKTAFCIFFVILAFILGAFMGVFGLANDHKLLSLLLIPGIVGTISAIIGFFEVFDAKS